MPRRVKKLPFVEMQGASVEQAQVQERKLKLPCMEPIRYQQRAAEGEQSRHLGSAEFVFAEDLEHVRQQRNARPEQHQSDKVQRMHMLFAEVRQVQIDHHQA